jgi:hypothetical protein
MNGGLLIIAALILAIQTASAQAQLPDPGTLPDSPFYGLKRFFEGIGTAFTFDQGTRATRALELAELRLAEARAMTSAGKPEFVQSLARDYANEIENSSAAIDSIENPERKIMASEKVAVATLHHLDVLESVYDQVPEQARSALAAAKDKSMEGNIKSLKALAEEDPDKAAEIAMLAAQNRAEKTREAAERGDEEGAIAAAEEYGEYQRFGQEISDIAQQLGKDPSKVKEIVAKARSIHVTVLEEVREKVPDDARQFIDEALMGARNETRTEFTRNSTDGVREQQRRDGEVEENEPEDQGDEESEENGRGSPSESPVRRP